VADRESAMADPGAGGGKKVASRIAIVRGVPDSFCDALSMTPPPQPVDLERARLQHAAYVAVLKGTVLVHSQSTNLPFYVTAFPANSARGVCLQRKL
jgi:hypothetical protein